MSEEERNKMVKDAIYSAKGARKKFVFCSSKKLSKAEKNYSVFKLELAGLCNGLLSARSLFSFAKLKVFVDAKSIVVLAPIK